MPRVAIIHYTLTPYVGGIEALIDAQCSALKEAGHEIRLIAGAGNGPQGVERRIIPGLLPPESDRAVTEAGVDDLVGAIIPALEDCDACWVHNILSLGLHPSLTQALWRLVDTDASREWVAWCEDLSSGSAYWSGPHVRPRPHPRVRYATISSARAREIHDLLGKPSDPVAVVRPQLQVEEWLNLAPDTRAIIRAADLFSARSTVFVPSKLLPHKRLDLAVDVCAALDRPGHRSVMLISASDSPHEPGRSREVEAHLQAQIERLGLRERVFLLSPMFGRPVDRGTMRDLMLLCDVTFVPSDEEGFGMPVVEALSVRAPVVCPDIPAFRESGPGAHFVPADAEPESIAAAVLEIVHTCPNSERRRAIQGWRDFCRHIDALARSRRAMDPARDGRSILE